MQEPLFEQLDNLEKSLDQLDLSYIGDLSVDEIQTLEDSADRLAKELWLMYKYGKDVQTENFVNGKYLNDYITTSMKYLTTEDPKRNITYLIDKSTKTWEDPHSMFVGDNPYLRKIQNLHKGGYAFKITLLNNKILGQVEVSFRFNSGARKTFKAEITKDIDMNKSVNINKFLLFNDLAEKVFKLISKETFQ